MSVSDDDGATTPQSFTVVVSDTDDDGDGVDSNSACSRSRVDLRLGERHRRQTF
ncbi:MAG: hypothetical protein ACLFVJ_12990 [Persicimonas sp.]